MKSIRIPPTAVVDASSPAYQSDLPIFCALRAEFNQDVESSSAQSVRMF